MYVCHYLIVCHRRRGQCRRGIRKCAALAVRWGAQLHLLLLFPLAAVSGGCQGLHSSAPVDGAQMQLRADPAQAQPSATFIQGKNANSPSTYRQVRSGVDTSGNRYREETTVKMGVVRDPLVSLPAAQPWGEWIVAGAGALALIGGCVLLYNGWPKVGGSLAVGGAVAMVVALTVGAYGWLYALGVIVLAGFTAWTLYSGYSSGLRQSAGAGVAAPVVAAPTVPASAVPAPSIAAPASLAPVIPTPVIAAATVGLSPNLNALEKERDA